MHGPDTDIGGSQRAFQSTLWTVVLKAKDPACRDRRNALETLIQAYWKPLYAFVRRKGKGPEAAKDITQGFFAELLAKDTLKYLDRSRGRFRTFLLAALEHYMADEYDKSQAQKRGGGCLHLPLDFEDAEREMGQQARTHVSPDRAYQRDWALRVLTRAHEALRASFESAGRREEFEAFKLHLTTMHPEGDSYRALAASLGISVEDVRNRIRSARARYREAILDVIRSYTETEEEAKDELRDLMGSFS